VLGNFEMCFMLLQDGASLTAADNKQWFPIHHSAYYGHMEITRLFAEKLSGLGMPGVDLQFMVPAAPQASIMSKFRIQTQRLSKVDEQELVTRVGGVSILDRSTHALQAQRDLGKKAELKEESGKEDPEQMFRNVALDRSGSVGALSHDKEELSRSRSSLFETMKTKIRGPVLTTLTKAKFSPLALAVRARVCMREFLVSFVHLILMLCSRQEWRLCWLSSAQIQH
jgi:ankyrin repeat protein